MKNEKCHKYKKMEKKTVILSALLIFLMTVRLSETQTHLFFFFAL